REMMIAVLRDQALRASSLKNEPAFYRNLEQALDTRRTENALLTAKPRVDDSVYDFTSSDFLSLNRSGRIRQAFLKELESHPDFRLSASGSRVQYGNYTYICQVEKEIADFYKAESAYIAHSGWLANVGVLAAVPLPGDAIVYDELVHASSHEGMKLSVAAHRMSFRHNDAESLRDVLVTLRDSQPAFRSGTRSILVCVESVYSMDGDVCPLSEFVEVVKEVFPLGNAQFVVDEAHSTGVIGPSGAGLVAMLGLEKDIAIRLHMSSKALGATGGKLSSLCQAIAILTFILGIILCKRSVRNMLLNHARFVVFSGAPSFPMVASIRAGYQLMTSGNTQAAQQNLQRVVRHFFSTITSHPLWDEITSEGLISIPLAEDWESRPFMTHIVAVHTRSGHESFLCFHLLLSNMNAYAISYPIVPKGTNRVRLVFHNHNTTEEVTALANAICNWAGEMLEIKVGKMGSALPTAARQVYALQASL
ncbi:8-amino-7-oxononanoate synthase, partial [Xylogone sp. PMI_703]